LLLATTERSEQQHKASVQSSRAEASLNTPGPGWLLDNQSSSESADLCHRFPHFELSQSTAWWPSLPTEREGLIKTCTISHISTGGIN